MAEKVRLWGQPEAHSRVQADLLFRVEPRLKSNHHHRQHRHCGRPSEMMFWQSKYCIQFMQTALIKNRGSKSFCTLSYWGSDEASGLRKQTLAICWTSLPRDFSLYSSLGICQKARVLSCCIHGVAKYSTYTYCAKPDYHKLLPAISTATHPLFDMFC